MTTYTELAEAAWRWVLEQVRWDDGPWIPTSVTTDAADIPMDRDGMHSGIAGLAHVLAEFRLDRPWTADEQTLADAIVERLGRSIPTRTEYDYFDGLVSAIGAFTALDAPGSEEAVDRLLALATPDGWPQAAIGPPRYVPETRIHDLTLGTAGVLLGALWAARSGVAKAGELADHAAGILLAELVELPTGANWLWIPQRFHADDVVISQMPNFSHGLAGIATSLALAGAELDRTDLTAAARRGAEHLVTLGDTSAAGFKVPRTIPKGDYYEDDVTYTWCHGPTGTSLLFPALRLAGVEEVAAESPQDWRRRCLHSVRTSGIPARVRAGFWDNDGRCCGTAGVGDVVLDAWHQTGDETYLRFAVHLADVLVERAIHEGPHAYWRFLEHREAAPLLPPGVGWMQGAAGIAGFLFHVGRVARDGTSANAVSRMDNWWAAS